MGDDEDTFIERWYDARRRLYLSDDQRQGNLEGCLIYIIFVGVGTSYSLFHNTINYEVFFMKIGNVNATQIYVVYSRFYFLNTFVKSNYIALLYSFLGMADILQSNLAQKLIIRDG